MTAPEPNVKKLSLINRVLHTAWMAILLGILLQLAIVGLGMAFGKDHQPWRVIAEALQKISWSFLVCVALIVGLGASNLRASMGAVCGFIGAPLAFLAAKAIHKGAAAGMGVTLNATNTAPSPEAWLVALIKALQYAALGCVLGWLSRKPFGGALAYMCSGLMAGLIFGGVIVYLAAEAQPKPPDISFWVIRGANEVIFPVGCSMIAFSVEALGRRLKE